MTGLGRIPEKHRFDLIVIGGGISGACMVHEATLYGLNAILLEAGDFGHANSSNSLRILHGGIRYLSRLQLRACRQSCAEQAWFARRFPRYTRSVRCLYPIENSLGDYLAARALKGVYRVSTWGLTRGGTETTEMDSRRANYHRAYREMTGTDAANFVDWEEVVMMSPARILIQLLKQSCLLGNACVNYTQVDRLDHRDGRIRGVYAHDVEHGTEYHFEAPFVVNCGAARIPGCEVVQSRLPRSPQSLAVNLVLRKPVLEDVILVGRGRQAGDNTILLTPRNGHLVAGTFHFATEHSDRSSQPSSNQLIECIQQLNRIFPQAEFERDNIVGVESGALPVSRRGERIPRLPDQIHTQMTRDGKSGLITVRNMKYTTAHRLARKTLHRIAPQATRRRDPGPVEYENFDWSAYHPNRVIPRQRLAETLKTLCRQEAVRQLSDLTLRRTEWGREASFRRQDLVEVADLTGLSFCGESLSAAGAVMGSLSEATTVAASGESPIQTS